MACYFYTGPRGSGKSLGAVHQIFEYLKQGRVVATNLDIYPKGIVEGDYKLFRLPDKPNADHFMMLGHAYSKGQKVEYDEKKNGLIVLDEISLFLTSKRDKEFQPLMEWLVQSRKWGWDLILIAQSKEQVNETVYKSLCDHLVLCKADKLVPIPYIGKPLKMIGLSGRLPDNHTALVLNGRSEQNDIIETISYSRKRLQGFYNTAQTFNDGSEYVNNELRDMRALYQVVPEYISSGQKIIDGLNSKIDNLKSKIKESTTIQEGDKMPVNHHKSTAGYIKIGLLVLGLLAFLYFNNPLDNPLIADDVVTQETVQEPIPEKLISEPIKNVVSNELQVTDAYEGVFESMIKDAELSIPVHSENAGLSAIIQIKTQTKLSFISLDDLRVLGWYSIKSGNVIFLKKGKTTIQVPLSLSGYDVKNNQ